MSFFDVCVLRSSRGSGRRDRLHYPAAAITRLPFLGLCVYHDCSDLYAFAVMPACDNRHYQGIKKTPPQLQPNYFSAKVYDLCLLPPLPRRSKYPDILRGVWSPKAMVGVVFGYNTAPKLGHSRARQSFWKGSWDLGTCGLGSGTWTWVWEAPNEPKMA